MQEYSNMINGKYFNPCWNGGGGSIRLAVTCLYHFIFSGVQLLCIGVLGEYVAKSYLEEKKWLIYI